MIDEGPCPCGSLNPYAMCCGPLHHGARTANTALELMRSRYSAYAKGELGYLLDTLHPDKRDQALLSRWAETNAGVRWTGLSILGTARGRAGDDAGTVEFEARYEGPEGAGTMRERSRFVRHDGDWVYVEPETAPAAGSTGRNDPCPCGSGKKYKKCCSSRR